MNIARHPQSTGTSATSKVVAAQGYAYLPNFYPELRGSDVVNLLGSLSTSMPKSSVHTVTPADKELRPPNTYSGIYGTGTFPFHTDMAHWRNPPRFLVLRCVKGFEQVPTLLIDGWEIVKSVGQGTLLRALVQPRRPFAGELPLMRLYQRTYFFSVVRWDREYIRPASRGGQEGFDKFTTALNGSKVISIALADKGSTLVIDNWRMLHGRAAVPVECQGRVLERAYLDHLA